MTVLLICGLITGPNYGAINFIKRNSYHCSFGTSAALLDWTHTKNAYIVWDCSSKLIKILH